MNIVAFVNIYNFLVKFLHFEIILMLKQSVLLLGNIVATTFSNNSVYCSTLLSIQTMVFRVLPFELAARLQEYSFEQK
jgi:hypothetical protein